MSRGQGVEGSSEDPKIYTFESLVTRILEPFLIF
jgi:hypothetical protein